MFENKYRVWCKNRNEWERDAVALLPDGTLIEIRTMRPLLQETHVVLRATGVHDKNVNEIFTGDVVRAVRRTDENYRPKMAVSFLNGCFMFGTCNAHELYRLFGEIEIIGNIYENPELLEVA